MVRSNLRLHEHGSPTRRELIAYRTFGIYLRERILSSPPRLAASTGLAICLNRRLHVGSAERRLRDAPFALKRFDLVWSLGPHPHGTLHRSMDAAASEGGAGFGKAMVEPTGVSFVADPLSDPSHS